MKIDKPLDFAQIQKINQTCLFINTVNLSLNSHPLRLTSLVNHLALQCKTT